MSAKFMLLYDKDHDIVFVELQTGALQWILPSSDSLSNLLHTTHVTETGQAYYEDLKSGAVTWTLPPMSAAALAAAKFVQDNHRSALEQRIGSSFSPEASAAQFSAIDDYLAYQDELKANGVAVDNADEDDGSDDEIVRESSLNERPSKAVVMRTVQQIKSMKLKTGYLNKLATQSGRNWKKRFFVLTPLNLAYYVSDDPGQKPKGELQILADGTVSEEKVDSKQGLGLRFNNGTESIVVAAASDVDRSHWMQALRSAIAGADRILRATVTVLGDSTVLINSRSAFSLGAKTAKRFVVFADGVITVHPDAATTTTIDGVLNVNAQTKLKVANERDRVLTLVDSDFKSTTLSLRFDCDPSRDPTTFLLWRRAIDAAMDDDDDDGGGPVRPNSARSVSSNSTTTSRRSVAAPGGGSGASIATAAAAAATAAADTTPARPLSMPANVGVFGLSFDDDNEDDDDEDDARSSVSSAPAAAVASTAAAASKAIATASAASSATTAAPPEASTPAVAAASTKLSALNRGARSFLRKRASKTPTTPTAAAPAAPQTTPPPPPPPKAATAAPPPPASQPSQPQAVANPLTARRAAAPPVAAAPVVHDDDDDDEGVAFGAAAAAANAFLLSNVDDEDDDEDGGRVPPQSNPLRAPPAAAVAVQPPPPTTTPTSKPPPPPATQPTHAATALPGHHHAHHAAASAVSPLHSAAQTASLRELVGDAEAQSIARVVEAALPSPTASLATTQRLTNRPVREFLAQTRRVEDAVLQQLDRADRDRAAWATDGGGDGDADAAMRKLRAMLRDSLQAASAAEKTNSAFQQLEQEKALLLQLLDHVQRTETLALQQIQRQETDALARIRDEAAHVQTLFETAQSELRSARATHEAEMERRLALLEQAKSFLDAEQRRLDDDFRAKMRDIALIARDLAAQHARLQLDRKKMLKSRYQLDLAMQDALRVAAATAAVTVAGYPAEETKRAYASPNVSPVSTRGRSAAAPSSSSAAAAARAAGAVRSASPASSSVHSVASGGGGGYYATGAGAMRTQPLPRDRSQSPAAGDYAAFRHTATGGGGSRATTPTSIAAQPRRLQQQPQQPQLSYPAQWAPLRQQPPPYAMGPPPASAAGDAYGDGFASPAAPAPPSSSSAAGVAGSSAAAVPPVLTGLNTIMSRLRTQQQQLMPQLAPTATHQHPLRHHTTTGAYQRQAPPSQSLQSQSLAQHPPPPPQLQQHQQPHAAYPPPQYAPHAPQGYYYAAAAPPPGHVGGYAPPPQQAAYAMPTSRYGR